MSWSTISHSGNQASASAEPICNENLFSLLERRSQRRKAKMLAAAAKDAAGERPSKATNAVPAQGNGSRQTSMQAENSSQIHPDDFEVVLQPRTTLALGATCQPGELGLSLAAYLGAQFAADLSLVLSRELKFTVASIKNAYMADRLRGDFVMNTAKGDVSLHGHLKESDEQVGHGVVTIANYQPAESPKDSIQWRQGTILYIRKFGTSNKARLTFAGNVKPWTVHYNSETITLWPYFRTIPACMVYAAVAHRANTYRNPSQDQCGLCRQQAPFVEGMWAPHECDVTCAVRGGVHDTISMECAAKYHKDTKMAPPKGAKNNTAKKPATPQPTHVTGGDDSPRQDHVNSAPARPSELA
ncbi:hypothetical protein HPB50_006045 [Hyalomma asiaticum]|uniref:Uncharacterized protein n=1 Tax=Hyalomma asiaticum TaxID=266040 RepID=A0ACB7RS72_HYAAI|nr:hypothetical protein HPB50_006045 [Hyalomma asiaticum]